MKVMCLPAKRENENENPGQGELFVVLSVSRDDGHWQFQKWKGVSAQNDVVVTLF